jgi:plasmid stabilization system protein ParE
MIVRWTAGALADLTSVENYQRRHWPESRGLRAAFDRDRASNFRISAERARGYTTVRRSCGAFIDLPYRLFYTVESDAIYVLAIRHASRQSLFE